MNRKRKEEVVADLNGKILNSAATFVVKYRGLGSKDVFDLRRKLYDGGGEFRVAKARLMKLAIEDVEGIRDYKANLKDQIGLIFAKTDAARIAKLVKIFSEEVGSLQVLSGFFEEKVLSKQEVDFLATILPREVLLAQLAMLLNSPVTSLARVLNMLIIRLAFVLSEVARAKGN
jgi:large subunit ribosomal protein L10